MGRARVLVGLLGTLIALVLALWILDWSALLHAFARLSAGVVPLASLLSVATTLILAVRWAILTAARQESYSARGFNDALVGQVFNLITPGGRRRCIPRPGGRRPRRRPHARHGDAGA